MPFSGGSLATYIPGFGLLRRLMGQRPDLLTAVTDTITLVALITSFVFAAIYALRSSSLAVRLSIVGFLLIGLIMGAREIFAEPYGFVRPVAPLLVFVFLAGVQARSPFTTAVPLLVSVGLAGSFAWQIGGVVRGLL